MTICKVSGRACLTEGDYPVEQGLRPRSVPRKRLEPSAVDHALWTLKTRGTHAAHYAELRQSGAGRRFFEHLFVRPSESGDESSAAWWGDFFGSLSMATDAPKLAQELAQAQRDVERGKPGAQLSRNLAGGTLALSWVPFGGMFKRAGGWIRSRLGGRVAREAAEQVLRQSSRQARYGLMIKIRDLFRLYITRVPLQALYPARQRAQELVRQHLDQLNIVEWAITKQRGQLLNGRERQALRAAWTEMIATGIAEGEDLGQTVLLTDTRLQRLLRSVLNNRSITRELGLNLSMLGGGEEIVEIAISNVRRELSSANGRYAAQVLEGLGEKVTGPLRQAIARSEVTDPDAIFEAITRRAQHNLGWYLEGVDTALTRAGGDITAEQGGELIVERGVSALLEAAEEQGIDLLI